MKIIILILIIINQQILCKNQPKKQFNILDLTDLSNGIVLDNNEIITSTSALIVVAIQHFNERYDGIVPEIGLYKSCNSTLNLLGGVIDDFGSAGTAMLELVGNSRFTDVDIILGPIQTANTEPIAITSGALKIPEMSYTVTTEDLSSKAEYPYFFRTVPSDTSTANAIAALYQQFGYNITGMIYPTAVYGTTMKSSLQTACASRNISLVSVSYDSDATGQQLYSQALEGLQLLVQQRIGVILYAAVNAEFLYAISLAAQQLNWVQGRLWVNYIGALTDVTGYTTQQLDVIAQFLNCSIIVEPQINLTNPNWLNLKKSWSTWNVTYVNSFYPPNATNGIDYTLASNYFKLGQQKVVSNSIYWALAYDAVIAIGLATCGPSAGTNLVEDLANVAFNGASGEVRFLSNYNRDPSSFTYTLSTIFIPINTLDAKVIQIAELLSGADAFVFSEEILFNDGTHHIPPDIEPPVNVVNGIPFGAKVFGYCECGVALFSSCFALCYVTIHRNDRVFVESQPIFMIILAFGCMLMASSIIPLTFENNIGCMLFPWLFAIGLVLSLSSISAKSIRVAILWYHRSRPVAQINRSVRGPVLLFGIFIILIIEIIILLCWQFIAPWTLILIVLEKDAGQYPILSSQVCGSNSSAATVFLALIVAYICLISFITACISIWVRNAPEKYQETKMTAIAGACILQVVFIGIPTTAAVWTLPLPRFLVLSSITFLFCMIIFFTLFILKIFKSRFPSLLVVSNNEQTNNNTFKVHYNDKNATAATQYEYQTRVFTKETTTTSGLLVARSGKRQDSENVHGFRSSSHRHSSVNNEDSISPTSIYSENVHAYRPSSHHVSSDNNNDSGQNSISTKYVSEQKSMSPTKSIPSSTPIQQKKSYNHRSSAQMMMQGIKTMDELTPEQLQLMNS